ncbi:MAG: histidine phosphatase family protein, partial [Candidatus Eremiobacterota bacterium]
TMRPMRIAQSALPPPVRTAARNRTVATDTLPLSPHPPGFQPVDDADGSLAYQGPSWVKRRLENNGVRLVAIRHGQSQSNADSEKLGQPLLYGQSESPLTDLGREQARTCAARLYSQLGGDDWLRGCLDHPEKLPVFLSSPVSRSMDSAELLVQHLRDRVLELGGEEALGRLASHLVVQPEPRLLETHFGRFEGHPLSDLQQAHPDFARNWLPPEGMGTDFRHRFPGGESRADVMLRMACLLDGVARVHAGRTVVVMTHGECLRATRAVLGQAPVQEGKVRAEGGMANATPYWLVGAAPGGASGG